MRKFGLIGKSLSHSFSPGYFKEKFKREHILDAEYRLYELDRIDQIKHLFEIPVSGLNVTIPYKEVVIPWLDILSDEARDIGAVNTIKYCKGKWVGYNTDAYGFESSLLPHLGSLSPRKALILGTGGASKAVAYVLNKLNIPFRFVSRKGHVLQYDELDSQILRQASLIVNTTPLGMYPHDTEKPAIPYEFINEQHLFFDLIYNPEKTLFLIEGEARHARILNGRKMLEFQAERAWQIWNDDICY